MKNRIVHHHEAAKIYRNYYKPSLNPFRFFKSILVVVLFGSSNAANGYDHSRKP